MKGRKPSTPVGLARTDDELTAWLERTRPNAVKDQVVHTINNGEPIKATFDGAQWMLETEGWVHS